jgi:hypothetical protein
MIWENPFTLGICQPRWTRSELPRSSAPSASSAPSETPRRNSALKDGGIERLGISVVETGQWP